MNLISRIPMWSEHNFDGMLIWFLEMAVRGLLFHPDDDPSEIISYARGTRLFSDTEAAELRSTVSEMFELKGDEVFEAGRIYLFDVSLVMKIRKCNSLDSSGNAFQQHPANQTFLGIF